MLAGRMKDVPVQVIHVNIPAQLKTEKVYPEIPPQVSLPSQEKRNPFDPERCADQVGTTVVTLGAVLSIPKVNVLLLPALSVAVRIYNHSPVMVEPLVNVPL